MYDCTINVWAARSWSDPKSNSGHSTPPVDESLFMCHQAWWIAQLDCCKISKPFLLGIVLCLFTHQFQMRKHCFIPHIGASRNDPPYSAMLRGRQWRYKVDILCFEIDVVSLISEQIYMCMIDQVSPFCHNMSRQVNASVFSRNRHNFMMLCLCNSPKNLKQIIWAILPPKCTDHNSTSSICSTINDKLVDISIYGNSGKVQCDGVRFQNCEAMDASQ